MLGLDRESKNVVTAEELHLVVAEAQTAGVLEESERAIISGIVRLADRPVREIMTPRTDIDWIDLRSTREQIRAVLAATPHGRLPVAEGSADQIVGVVSTRDMLAALLDGGNRPGQADAPGAGHSRLDGRDGCLGRAASRRSAAGAGA